MSDQPDFLRGIERPPFAEATSLLARACATDALVFVSTRPRVLRREFMAVPAERTLRTQDVLETRDWFEMSWITATPNAAHVIEVEPIGDRANEADVDDAMHEF